MSRLLYLHGFASGPRSRKGVALAAHFRARGLTVDLLDLRVPSAQKPRVSAMIEVVERAMANDQVVIVGSSLGGLCTSRVAVGPKASQVRAVGLLAPAFRLVQRWRERLGPVGFQGWRERGWLEIHDHALGRPSRVDFGFVEELEASEQSGADNPDVKQPALVIHGTRDAVVDIRWSREWARGRANVRMVEVDDVHELTASLPLITRELEAFLGTISFG